MSKRMDGWVEDFIMKPVIFLVGLYISAVILASFLGLEGDLFPRLFTAAGGVVVLGAYFKGKLNEG